MTDGAHPFSVVIGMPIGHWCRPRLLATPGERVLLMESRQTPEREPDRPRAARRGHRCRLGTPLRLESFSALFPSLTNVVVSPVFPGTRTSAGHAQAGLSGLLANFGGLGVQPRHPWIGINRHNGKDPPWTHLVATCWSGPGSRTRRGRQRRPLAA